MKAEKLEFCQQPSQCFGSHKKKMEKNKVKKSIKFIVSVLIAVLLISTFVSCSNSDVPDGYQLVACEGDCFRLYVPTQWVLNTSSGVTGAYYSAVDNTSISVHTASDAGDMTISDYWTFCNERYADELADYKAESKAEKIVLGGQAAEKHVFSASVTVYSETEKKNVTATYKFMQVLARYKDEMYILTYCAPEESYENNLEIFEGNAQDEGVIPYFRFAEPYVSENGDKEISDKVSAPDGMKLASTDERAYRLFVPKEWKINNRTGATAAYASDGDSSNVSVQMYMSSDNTETAEKYWERLETSYKNMFSAFELISDEAIEMDGIAAHKYTYTTTSAGQDYKIVQAIVKKGDMFYCLTFTALPENFDRHLPDVEKMISNFDIR